MLESFPLKEDEEFLLKINYNWEKSILTFTKDGMSFQLPYLGNSFDKLMTTGIMNINFMGFLPLGN